MANDWNISINLAPISDSTDLLYISAVNQLGESVLLAERTLLGGEHLTHAESEEIELIQKDLSAKNLNPLAPLHQQEIINRLGMAHDNRKVYGNISKLFGC